MRHKTTDKGDIGVAIVTADLIKKKFSVFTPISATCPFDLLISKNNKYLRIQVKYRKIRNGTLTVDLKRNTIFNGKNIITRKNKNVDIVAIYCPNTNKCYYVDVKRFKKTFVLRIENSKNNQKKKIR